MVKKSSILLLLVSLSFSALAQMNDRILYIETFKEIAIKEMERTGIPASIKLGQAILESNAGKSELSQKAKNHFGIKCGGSWNGRKFFIKDDDKDHKGNLINSCFRVFQSPEESFIAHSEFLRDPAKNYRYGFLFDLDPLDYKSWAEGLQKAGYATNPSYASILISVIENYQLFQFDQFSFPLVDIEKFPEITTDSKKPFNFNKVFVINDVKLLYAKKDETPEAIMQRSKVAVRRILKYNEKIVDAKQPLPEKTPVFLQPKRNNFRGNKVWHYVKEGETMYDIAQLYGLKLEKLYKKNNIEPPAQPAINQRIRIRGRYPAGERPVLTSETNPNIHIPPPATSIPPDSEHDIFLEPDAFPTDTTRKKAIQKTEKSENQTADSNENSKNEPKKITRPHNIPDVLPAPPTENRTTEPTDKENPNPPVANPEKAKEIIQAIDNLYAPIDNLHVEVFGEEAVIKGSVQTQMDKLEIIRTVGNVPGIRYVEERIEIVPPTSTTEIHRVQKGDTLYNISRRYNLSVDQLKALNNLSDNTIFVNQELKVK